MDSHFDGDDMKRVDLWRAKLKAAKAERRIVTKQHNMIVRTLRRLTILIEDLERKIGNVEKH